MCRTHPRAKWLTLVVGTSLVLSATIGCQSVPGGHHGQGPTTGAAVPPIPRELCKVVLPTYTIEPPDILLIDALHIVPKAPYRLRTYDTIDLQVYGTLSEAPISGTYPVQMGGMVNLGFRYGSVPVAGLAVEEAADAIANHLRQFLREVDVTVTLADIAAKQQIAGQHLVGPDGTVNLGVYGSVRVAGLTKAQAKFVVERHLAQSLHAPEVAIDVYAYNSKVYYVVTEGAGLGDGVYRFPVTGNETVLDAIAQINGLEQVSSKRIWVARPTHDPEKAKILPVDWNDVTAAGVAATNYQIMPGDRIFIAEDKLVAFDVAIGKITTPWERIMGFSLLGVGTVTRFSGNVLRGGGNANSNF